MNVCAEVGFHDLKLKHMGAITKLLARSSHSMLRRPCLHSSPGVVDGAFSFCCFMSYSVSSNRGIHMDKDARISLRIPTVIKRLISSQARAEIRSVNSVIEIAIKEYLLKNGVDIEHLG